MSDAIGRYMPSGQYLALKTNAKKLIEGVHGLEAAAASTRGSVATLQRAYDKLRPDCYLGVDQVLDLEMISGTPHVTRRLAEAQGYKLVRASAHVASISCPERAALKIAKASGDYAEAVSEAAADSQYTLNEINDLIAKAERAKEEIDATLDGLYQRQDALMGDRILDAAE